MPVVVDQSISVCVGWKSDQESLVLLTMAYGERRLGPHTGLFYCPHGDQILSQKVTDVQILYHTLPPGKC